MRKTSEQVMMAGALAVAILAVSPARADLPGMPAPAPQGDTNGGGKAVRPGDERPVEVAQSLPVRGSLFRQGAVASAAAAASLPEGDTRVSAVNLIAVAPTQPRKY